MHFETFAHGASCIHRLDPRIRLISALALALGLAFLQNLYLAAAGLALGGALVRLAALSPGAVMRRMFGLNLFVCMVWVFLPFSVPGEILFQAGPFSATWQGVCAALLITLKSNAIILVSLALFCTLQVTALIRAMQALGLPEKICQILFFSLRYFQVVQAEYQRLHEAMTARAFTPRTNLHTLRSYAYLISMLLVRSLNRGQRVYEAMLCRGYSGKLPSLSCFCLQRADIVFLVLSLSGAAVFWIMDSPPACTLPGGAASGCGAEAGAAAAVSCLRLLAGV